MRAYACTCAMLGEHVCVCGVVCWRNLESSWEYSWVVDNSRTHEVGVTKLLFSKPLVFSCVLERIITHSVKYLALVD